MTALEQRLLAAYDATPKIDGHSHLYAARPPARSIEQIVFYHMVVAELRAAGMDTTMLERRHDRREALDILALLPDVAAVWGRMSNTALARAVQAIGRDLFGLPGPVNLEFLRGLAARAGTDSEVFGWSDRVLAACGVETVMAAVHLDRGTGRPHGPAQYARVVPTNEHDPFHIVNDMRAHQERMERYHGVRLTSIESVQDYLTKQLEQTHACGARVQVKWIGPDFLAPALDMGRVEQAVAKAAEGHAWLADDVAALQALEMTQRLEFARTHRHVMQVCLCSSHLPGLTYSMPYVHHQHLRSIAAWIGRYPDVPFEILNCDVQADQFFANMARTHGNVYLSGVWWHAMSEGYIEEMMYRRIVSVPVAKLGGFFSDAYVVEWVYGKHWIMRVPFARAFARAVSAGYFTEDDACMMMRTMLYGVPRRLYQLESRENV